MSSGLRGRSRPPRGRRRRLHHVRELERPPDGLADPAHPLRVRVHDRDRAEVVQRSLGLHRGGMDELASRRPRRRGAPGSPRARSASCRAARRPVAAPYGIVGVVEEQKTFGSRTIPIRSGMWPPPEPSTWYAWIARPAIASTVSCELARLVQPVGVQADLDVVRVGDTEHLVDHLGVGAPVLVDLESDGARLDRRPRAARAPRSERTAGARCSRGGARRPRGCGASATAAPRTPP